MDTTENRKPKLVNREHSTRNAHTHTHTNRKRKLTEAILWSRATRCANEILIEV